MPYGYQIHSLVMLSANKLVLEYDLSDSEREAIVDKIIEGENHLTVLLSAIGEEYILTREDDGLNKFFDAEYVFLSGMIRRGGAITQRDVVTREVFLCLIVKELESLLIILIKDLQSLLNAGKMNNSGIVNMIYDMNS